MKYDYFYKAQILDTRLPYFERKISKLEYDIGSIQYSQYNGHHFTAKLTEEDKRLIKAKRSAIEYFNNQMQAEYGFTFDDSPELLIETHKINKAYYTRVKRLKDKVSAMLESKCLFLTITFNDKYYTTTSDKTKRKYVQRLLTKLGCEYVANVDYGKKNDRLHYHALVKCEHIDHTSWKYGNIDFKRVLVPNYKAISKYICKLTNHAIKETTHGNRLLYDKK